MVFLSYIASLMLLGVAATIVWIIYVYFIDWIRNKKRKKNYGSNT